jgi:hypothetical protein
MAVLEGPTIMTPSIRAWPPIVVFLEGFPKSHFSALLADLTAGFLSFFFDISVLPEDVLKTLTDKL